MSPFDRFITHLAPQPIFPMLVICMCFGAAAVVGMFEEIPL